MRAKGRQECATRLGDLNDVRARRGQVGEALGGRAGQVKARRQLAPEAVVQQRRVLRRQQLPALAPGHVHRPARACMQWPSENVHACNSHCKVCMHACNGRSRGEKHATAMQLHTMSGVIPPGRENSVVQMQEVCLHGARLEPSSALTS